MNSVCEGRMDELEERTRPTKSWLHGVDVLINKKYKCKVQKVVYKSESISICGCKIIWW